MGLCHPAVDRGQKLLALLRVPRRAATCHPALGRLRRRKIYYDGSPETRHARNIMENPRISLHLESGDQVVILEGTGRPAEKPSPELGQKLAQAYQDKYATHGYAPEPDQWDEGGLYVFSIQKAIAWTNFIADPTKFVF